MKAFGYPVSSKTNTKNLISLSEVTFAASAQELELLEKFLRHTREKFQDPGKIVDHIHVGEGVEWHGNWPDIIIKNPQS